MSIMKWQTLQVGQGISCRCQTLGSLETSESPGTGEMGARSNKDYITGYESLTNQGLPHLASHCFYPQVQESDVIDYIDMLCWLGVAPTRA